MDKDDKDVNTISFLFQKIKIILIFQELSAVADSLRAFIALSDNYGLQTYKFVKGTLLNVFKKTYYLRISPLSHMYLLNIKTRKMKKR